MRDALFFFSQRKKKRFSQHNGSSLFALSFLLSLCLSLSLSLSLSLFVQVIFEGGRERDCFSAAVLLQLLSSLSRGCVPSRVSALSLFFRCLSVRVSFKESEEEKKGQRKRKKKTKKTDLSFFLSLNHISTKTHHANTKKTSERSTTAATDSF